MKKIIAYYRVSTDHQYTENQRKVVRDWIESLPDVEIAKEYEDEYISGMKKDRKGLGEVLENLDGYDGIVVFDESRLTRDFEFGMNLMFKLQKANKSLYIAQSKQIMSFDITNDQLIHSIKVWLAADERNRFRDRIKAGLQRVKAEGKKLGRPFAGIKWSTFHKWRDMPNPLSKRAARMIMGVKESTFYDKYKEHIKECELCQNTDPKYYNKVMSNESSN